MLEINQSKFGGFFNGASQGNPRPNGAGGIMFLSIINIISFKEKLGMGSNNWDKLHALKLLLRLTIDYREGNGCGNFKINKGFASTFGSLSGYHV
jgi:hypothetical protein